MRWWRSIVVSVFVVAAMTTAAVSQSDEPQVRRSGGRRSPVPWLSEVAKLTASDCAPNDNFGLLFGSPAAIEGDTVVIGAYRDENDAGVEAGSAYLFTRSGDTWTEQQKITASDTEAGDWFGGRPTVHGDTVFISAIRDDHTGLVDPGSVYVFSLAGGTLVEQQKLVSDTPIEDAWFGWGIATDADTVVVTSSQWLSNGFSGAAHVWVWSGDSWVFQQELIGSDVAPNDVFGQTVAISGDMVVVGAPNNSHSGQGQAGAAYVFTRSGDSWTEHQKIVASDPEADEFFGTFVSISGNTLMISAQFDESHTAVDTGSVYVFDWSGGAWVEQQKLTASDGGTGDWFGDSIVIEGSVAVVSAIHHDLPGIPDAGAVYAFSRTGDNWVEREKVTAGDAAESDKFGWGLAWSGDTVLAGAPLDNHSGSGDAGSVYVLELALYVDGFESGDTSAWSAVVP